MLKYTPSKSKATGSNKMKKSTAPQKHHKPQRIFHSTKRRISTTTTTTTQSSMLASLHTNQHQQFSTISSTSITPSPTTTTTTTKPTTKNLLKKNHNTFTTTRPQLDMDPNPLMLNRTSSTHHVKQSPNRILRTSALAGGKKLTVLLAGFNSYIAQHLYLPLKWAGLDIIPVTTDPCTRHDPLQTLHYKQIEEQGIPDVDFVINCSGTNIFNPLGIGGNKQLVEESRLGTTKFWVDQIRNTRAKPYAFVNMSSMLYYPGNTNIVYDESWKLPAPPLPWQLDEPAYQSQELSLPYWSRLFRNIEHEGRVFKPELDARTPEQIAEYNRVRSQYLNDDLKSEVYTNTRELSPEQQRAASNRKDLFTNKEVRVIDFRMGHLLARHMQEHIGMQPYLDRGYLAHIGDGKSVHPWIHVDDACDLLINAIFDENVQGPINAVAPNFATNSQLLTYMTESRRSWKNDWFSVKPQTVEAKFGTLIGDIFTSERKIVPKVAKEMGYQYQFPTIESAIENGLESRADKESSLYGGWVNIPRNRGKRYVGGLTIKSTGDGIGKDDAFS